MWVIIRCEDGYGVLSPGTPKKVFTEEAAYVSSAAFTFTGKALMIKPLYGDIKEAQIDLKKIKTIQPSVEYAIFEVIKNETKDS